MSVFTFTVCMYVNNSTRSKTNIKHYKAFGWPRLTLPIIDSNEGNYQVQFFTHIPLMLKLYRLYIKLCFLFYFVLFHQRQVCMSNVYVLCALWWHQASMVGVFPACAFMLHSHWQISAMCLIFLRICKRPNTIRCLFFPGYLAVTHSKRAEKMFT